MARSCSLHIGINRTGRGTPDRPERGTLQFCHADAETMASIARANKYDSTVLLLDTEATFDRVVEEVNRAVAHIGDDGIFLWTFSGHGTIVPASAGEEDGKYDEGWVLCDGILLDNCIRALIAQFHRKAAVVIVSDCCYSGDCIRDDDDPSGCDSAMLPSEKLHRAKQLDEAMLPRTIIESLRVRHCPCPSVSIDEVEAAVIGIGACEELQIAADGAFTPTLGELMAHAPFAGGYEGLVKAIDSRLPPSQTPTFKTYGRRDEQLLSGRPFSIPESLTQPSPTPDSSFISIV